MSFITVADAIDASKVDKIRAICTEWKAQNESFGIDPLGVYCAHTGRKIGQLDDGAIWSLAQVIELDGQPNFMVIDQILESTMLACRPSPAWTIQTPERIRQLIRNDPIGACVFYFSRAYHQNNRHALKAEPNTATGTLAHCWTSTFAQSQWNLERVKLHAFFANNFPKRTIVRLSELLLEVDARIGVHNLKPKVQFIDCLLDRNSLADTIRYYREHLAAYKKAAIKRHKPSTGTTISQLVYGHYESQTKRPSKKRQAEDKKQKQRAMLAAVFQSVQGFKTKEDVAENREAGSVATQAVYDTINAMAKHAPTSTMTKVAAAPLKLTIKKG